ncbi:MAG: DUF5654 family protein [Patescibacteria group bacterium]
MANIETPSNLQEVPLSIVKNMISLATSGFGVVVALAWNEAIKRAVETYVDPYLGKNSGVASMLIYAAAMTLLAVFVTMQLAFLQKKLEVFNEIVGKKSSKQDDCDPTENADSTKKK